MTGELCLLDTVVHLGNGFTTGMNENGDMFILCHACHKRSYNQRDIEQAYCAFCRIFHEDSRE